MFAGRSWDAPIIVLLADDPVSSIAVLKSQLDDGPRKSTLAARWAMPKDVPDSDVT